MKEVEILKMKNGYMVRNRRYSDRGGTSINDNYVFTDFFTMSQWLEKRMKLDKSEEDSSYDIPF